MPPSPHATPPIQPTDPRLREVFDLIERHVERRYGVPVVIADVASPFTGDLDGHEIRIDHEVAIDEAVFILVHLFGHTVQWNLSAEARDIGRRTQEDPSEERLLALEEYERTACRYSLQLFHEAGVHDLDQWLSDFAACDLAYLRHFYASREKRPFRSFWRDRQPLLPPLAIPEFQPTRWHARWEGTVV